MTRLLTWLFNQSRMVQRLIAWSAVALVLICATLASFGMIDYRKSRVIQVQEKRELVARLERAVALGASVDKASGVSLPKSKLFLEGDSTANASATLHSMIGGVVEANSAELSSVVSLPDKSSGGVKLVGLKVIISGELEDVHKVIFALESATPPLMIDTLSLQVIPQRKKNAPSKMAVNLNVLGALSPKLVSDENAS